MEFKVYVDGKERVISNLNQNTCVKELIITFAKLLNKIGKYVLVECKSFQNFDTKCVRILKKDEKLQEIIRNQKLKQSIDTLTCKISYQLIYLEDKNILDKLKYSLQNDEDTRASFLNSISLQEQILEHQKSFIQNNDLNYDIQNFDELIYMFNTRLCLLNKQISDRKTLIKQLENENQLLNCSLYKIRDEEFLDYEKIYQEPIFHDNNNTNSPHYTTSNSSSSVSTTYEDYEMPGYSKYIENELINSHKSYYDCIFYF
jgi:hypothetical protein